MGSEAQRPARRGKCGETLERSNRRAIRMSPEFEQAIGTDNCAWNILSFPTCLSSLWHAGLSFSIYLFVGLGQGIICTRLVLNLLCCRG